MPEPGTRRTFVADGHDVATSIRHRHHADEEPRREGFYWLTPEGEVLVEGCAYVKEWRIRFRTTRAHFAPGEANWRLLAYRGQWEIAGQCRP